MKRKREKGLKAGNSLSYGKKDKQGKQPIKYEANRYRQLLAISKYKK
jgi:hypothetical protein